MRITKTVRNAGFSLVELMVVVGIIGVLASIAMPKFAIFQAKAKMSEAKANLSHIYTLQTAYYAEFDTYRAGPAGLVAIGFKQDGAARYGYTTTGGATFIATARNNIPNKDIAACSTVIDTWTIDQNKTVGHPQDGTSGC